MKQFERFEETKDVKPKNKNGGFVYVIEYDGFVKIGMTQNPFERFSYLNSESVKYFDKRIKRIALTQEHSNYSENEKLLHTLLKNKRKKRSEFFSFSFDEAVSFVIFNSCLFYETSNLMPFVKEQKSTSFLDLIECKTVDVRNEERDTSDKICIKEIKIYSLNSLIKELSLLPLECVITQRLKEKGVLDEKGNYNMCCDDFEKFIEIKTSYSDSYFNLFEQKELYITTQGVVFIFEIIIEILKCSGSDIRKLLDKECNICYT